MTHTTPGPGSVALITGGTGGFGRALAARLREGGVTVVLADLDSERNRSVAADLGCGFAVLDVTDRAANRAVVEQVEAEHGRLDAVFLNAGIAGFDSDELLDVDGFLRVLDVDLLGVVYGTAAALPALQRAGGGAIVVTASLAGLSPMATDPGYSVAKGGAVAFVRSMAPRLAAEGITVTAVCPGFADTAIIDPIRAEFQKAGFPVLTAGEVADAMLAAWASGEPGAAYIVQPGIGAVPYRFKGVPSARTATGETAVVPEALRPPSMR
ncbi:SDR family oxidoreductase [Geodermatophilus sabuli]|uniref:NADP-dependent 3-hydroxy acid dehydrogenase YdfG n=1 Tax=Geodermatophilus sabuli TaxID=1564158 RepID=A0A285EEJ9_9ACTN|nr:SDR family oxidoreductase [Geodermatophilus sabuli]MBB3084234.1 NAD(P)-dependent dehydrogenase (short-subunit alcohol dehydrogenase family) [Geodermatophilus sabuli]SNX96496.1 NADP-dependent 3-hydroxy acid dehydrogenase YdfG [Geodermatophilus sabuli]